MTPTLWYGFEQADVRAVIHYNMPKSFESRGKSRER